jgi:hypothetical protein
VELQRHRSAHWSLRWDDQQQLLMAEAGDDERFGISDLDAQEAAPLIEAWLANSFEALGTAPAATQTALEKLCILGAVTSGAPAGVQPLRVLVLAVGTSATPAANALQSIARDQLYLASGEHPGIEWEAHFDFVVVIRAGSSYADLLASTQPLAKIPHLLIDASFHHTLSIGPVVVPGMSACLQCLTTRLANRWGETLPPSLPKASENPELLAALALDEILKWHAGSSMLVGKVRQIDTHTWHTATDTLLKTTPCQRCSESEIT